MLATRGNSVPPFKIRFEVVYKPPRKTDYRVFVVGNIPELSCVDLEKLKLHPNKLESRILAAYNKRNRPAVRATSDSEDSDQECQEAYYSEENERLFQFCEFFKSTFVLLESDPDDVGIENLWTSDHITVLQENFVYMYAVWDFERNRLVATDEMVKLRSVQVPPYNATKNPENKWTIRDYGISDMRNSSLTVSKTFSNDEEDDVFDTYL